MASATMGPRLSDVIKWEQSKLYSREAVTVLSGQNLKRGHVVGIVTASGKAKEYNPANSDGSENIAGVMVDDCDATSADKVGTILKREAVVSKDGLVFFSGATANQKATAYAALAALGIVPKDGA